MSPARLVMGCAMLGAMTVAAAPPPDQGISRELARERASLISNVRYELSLELKPGATSMPGRDIVRFDLARGVEILPLDFRELDVTGAIQDGIVNELKINGAAVTAEQSNGHVLLPGKLLHAGANTVELAFESSVAAANRAVTRFVDPEDNNEYWYTLFVPMDASLAFPCFDQPDLKARFTLNVTAPSEWTVVSNAPVKTASADGATKHTSFHRIEADQHVSLRIRRGAVCRTDRESLAHAAASLRSPLDGPTGA